MEHQAAGVLPQQPWGQGHGGQREMKQPWVLEGRTLPGASRGRGQDLGPAVAPAAAALDQTQVAPAQLGLSTGTARARDMRPCSSKADQNLPV